RRRSQAPERRPLVVRRADGDRRVGDARVGDRRAESVRHARRAERRVLDGEPERAADAARHTRREVLGNDLDPGRNGAAGEPEDALLSERLEYGGVGERLGDADQVVPGDGVRADAEPEPAGGRPARGEAHVIHRSVDAILVFMVTVSLLTICVVGKDVVEVRSRSDDDPRLMTQRDPSGSAPNTTGKRVVLV